jgi:tetratricopeptide (TPR) repeat protein
MDYRLHEIKSKVAEGNLQQAHQQCEALLKKEPKNFYAREALGLILQQQGSLEAAEKIFRELLTIAPNYIHAHITLAAIQDEKGHNEASIKHLDNAINTKLRSTKSKANNINNKKSNESISKAEKPQALSDEMLPLLPRGKPFNYSADRFSIWGQEVAFMADPFFIESWNKVISKTSPHITDPAVYKVFWRAHIAVSIISQIQRKKLVIVECGVHHGHLMQTVMHYFDNAKEKEIDLHLFDTFRGIPPEQINNNESIAHWHNKNSYIGDYFDITKSFFSDFSKVKFYRGKVPDTLANFKENYIDFLSLDMNIVAPEKKALEFFWPKIKQGGALLIDDYGFQNHTTQQVMYDKFFSKNGILPMQLPTGQAVVFKT